MGKILAVSSVKGGCGKTTLTLSLTAEAQRRGLSVACLDADPTQVLHFWCNKRGVVCHDVRNFEAVDKLLLTLKAEFDVVLIDTGGFDHKLNRQIITSANVDVVVFPAKTSPIDLFVLRPYLKEAVPVLEKIHKNVIAVLMECDHLSSATKDILEVKDVLGTFGIKTADNFTVKRKDYRRNFLRGGDHCSNIKAREEISNIFNEVVV